MDLGALRNDLYKDKSNETRITEGYAGTDTRSSFGDDESKAKIIRPQRGIGVERSYGVRSDTGQTNDAISKIGFQQQQRTHEVIDNFY